MKIITIFVCFLLVIFMIVSCSKEQPTAPQVNNEETSLAKSGNTGGYEEATFSQVLADMNIELAGAGAEYRIEMAEILTDPANGDFGTTIIAEDRGNKQLGHDFVPGDPRRAWGDVGGTGITWINDLSEGGTASGLSSAQTDAAIGNAMNTWQSVNCSDIPLINFGSVNFDFGYVQALLGFGGVLGIGADLTHAGWLPGAFFDAIAPGGSNFILGVTFTFVFTASDIDNNGKSDTAFREIYYNDAFSWADDGSTNIDVESVAVHEAGHGLSQGHFGKVFLDNKGKLKFAPKAVMNAVYAGPQQSLLGTDNGGHCSNWGSWPNN